MARGINKVILIGNLGAEPEVRYTPGGSAIANATLATSTSWKDKQTGEMQDRVEWHRVVFFNRLAEIVGEYLHKATQLKSLSMKCRCSIAALEETLMLNLKAIHIQTPETFQLKKLAQLAVLK